MRMVQVGVLGMGKWWVQVGLKSPDVEVAGYVDINPGHLKAIQDEFASLLPNATSTSTRR